MRLCVTRVVCPQSCWVTKWTSCACLAGSPARPAPSWHRRRSERPSAARNWTGTTCCARLTTSRWASACPACWGCGQSACRCRCAPSRTRQRPIAARCCSTRCRWFCIRSTCCTRWGDISTHRFCLTLWFCLMLFLETKTNQLMKCIYGWSSILKYRCTSIKNMFRYRCKFLISPYRNKTKRI